MTRTGAAILAAQKDCGKEEGVRYCTVTCGLVPARNEAEVPRLKNEAFSDVFQDIAKRVGVYRHIVSLVANKLILNDPSLLEVGWKTYFDQVWSAVDAVAKKATTGNLLFRSTLDILSKVELPPPVYFDLRQQETAQMAVQAKEHTKEFPTRLQPVFEVKLAKALPSLQWKDVERIARIMLQYTLCAPSELCGFQKALEAACGQHRKVALSIVDKERLVLGEVVSRGRRYVTAQNTLHHLVPHMIRLSSWSEEWLDEHFGERQEHMTEESNMASFGTDEEDDVGIVRKWRRSRLPKSFSALPISSLQAAHVFYAYTEVKQLLSGLSKVNRKRKKDTEDDNGVRVDPERFAEVIFNVESFKGKRGHVTLEDGRVVPKWRIAAFRTDGVSARIIFVSGMCPQAFNASQLCEQGYNIHAPSAPINLEAVERGLYFVGERRCDIMPTKTPIYVHVVDPGFVKPLHASGVCTTSSSPMVEAKHWYITEPQLMKDSGRLYGQEIEAKRRRDTKYGNVMQALCHTGRRKSVTSTFDTYMDTMLQSLCVRSEELTSHKRSAFKWKQRRQLSRFLGGLADTLLRRTSLRVNKVVKNVSPNDSVLQCIEAQRRERTGTKTVVFFGDASFGPTRRGFNSIPKKKILKELCHRGVTVLLDEFRTSKMCPCGQDELQTTTGRLRAHKSDGSVCSMVQSLPMQSRDRDALAALNMIRCASCALCGDPRPRYLCRG